MNELKNIYENENIIIWEDNKGYDFKYHIENKQDYKVVYYLNGLDDYLVLEANDYLNFLGGEYDNEYIECILNGDAEEYFLSSEIYNLYLELKAKEEKNEDIDKKYLEYKMYWLNETINKIFN